MRIAHISPSYFPSTRYGGPPRSLHRLTLVLANLGHSLRVLTTDADGPDHVLPVETGRETTLQPNLNVYYARRQKPESISVDLLSRMGEVIQWADIVHLTAVYSFPTWPALALCRRWNKPMVWSPRGAFERWKGSRRVVAKAVWDQVCGVLRPSRCVLHVTSDREKRMSECRMPGVPIAVIPNGVDLPPRTSRPVDSSETRLLYLGRLDPKKGIENLLHACASLPSGASSWSLTVAGEGEAGYAESLRLLTRELKLETRVQWMGNVEGDAKEQCFQKATWVVVPSYTENFCQVVAESLARAVPVIASDGTPWEGVRERGCGLWVSNAPGPLASAIVQASRLPAMEMGERGRAWMEEEFRWEVIGEQMSRLYGSLIGASNES